MPDVARTGSPSNRPSERSSSATGGGVVRYGSVAVSPNAVDIAWTQGPHSSAVAGRRRETRSSGTGGVYRSGVTLRQPVRSTAQVGERRHHPAVLVLVLGESEFGEDVLGVLLHGTRRDHQRPGDRGVRVALRDQAEHLALARGQATDGIVGAATGEQLGDHLWVEDRATGDDIL